jgi:ubiquinone/menaquinone biosynthesis C-methylase UbiE
MVGPANDETQAEWAKREWFEAQAQQGADDAASYFGHAANGYQRYRHRQLLDALHGVAGELKRDALLDLGCAAGDLTALIGQHFRFRRTVGVDFVADVLERGRNRFPSIEFRQGALPEIGFPDGSFDLVIASEVLYYLTEAARRQAVEEIHRVLRPGGFLLFTAVLGGPYFSAAGARELVAAKLKPVRERLLRMKPYHALTQPFYMAARLRPMLARGQAPASEEMRARLERWRPVLNSAPARAAVSLAAGIARPLLASESLPAMLGNLPGARASNIILVARRDD